MAMRDHPVSGYKRVFIVDDDSALRRSLAEQLQLHDEFAISEAATGSEKAVTAVYTIMKTTGAKII